MELIRVSIKNGKNEFVENIFGEDLQEYFDYFKELQTNGANPELEKMTIDEWFCPVKFCLKDIDEFSGKHFIFGFIECLLQSENRPIQIGYDNDIVEVRHE